MKVDVKGAIINSGDKWIYDWFGIEATCPKDVNNLLEKANGQDVDVYINSGGGDIFAGSEIYSSLREYKGRVNIHVVGLAASAASVIACAGKSEISPTAMVMVHNVSGGNQGDYQSMDKTSEILQKANKSIAAAYIAKTGMSEKEALDMMDKETWLTAQQAVDKGLIDTVAFESNQLVASYESGLLPKEVIEKMRNSKNNPLGENQADILLQQKAQAKLKLLNLGGAKI
ncbi:head maturation protease, ClpP-related [Ruminiclostridium papyrosolvens]|uniref:ATP-dependent Clp protease proteolytic subunit n=1 Tax=Ruminiclostridium papyrosolvens C7 TaxID=1330534 RepID=U4R420_9FIRM|nr:head maturation protease, ClpP-related [Ruminiclostridium papyrosolvens]EPR12470.1 peptidase [Ruminiclostridium papyrosolvens C7]